VYFGDGLVLHGLDRGGVLGDLDLAELPPPANPPPPRPHPGRGVVAGSAKGGSNIVGKLGNVLLVPLQHGIRARCHSLLVVEPRDFHLKPPLLDEPHGLLQGILIRSRVRIKERR